MSRLMKMENVVVLEDGNQMLENKQVSINETHLWCEPLTTQLEIDAAKRHLLLTRIPYVHAKFDTTMFNAEEKLMHRRVSGLFVRKLDLWEGRND